MSILSRFLTNKSAAVFERKLAIANERALQACGSEQKCLDKYQKLLTEAERQARIEVQERTDRINSQRP